MGTNKLCIPITLALLLTQCDVKGQTDSITLYKNGKRIEPAKNEKRLYDYSKRIDFYFKDLTIKDTIEIDISNSIFDVSPDIIKYDFFRIEKKETLALSGHVAIDNRRRFVLTGINYHKLMGIGFVIMLRINDIEEKYILFIAPK
ncbi:MAG: hypothetical protein CRN43_14160 [Candidatus Nephrothrix sp. EaCA]|nr:MAG: hypothetical protein CRN43_14160 [Candidatus Nephrothrix sp. EaCA]